MKVYVCTVCGYLYEESKGVPGTSILPGTKWEDLPDTWSCPLCGAPKTAFREKEEQAIPLKDEGPKQMTPERELSAIEVSVICSNLARGCEKQYLDKESEQFSLLAAKFAGFCVSFSVGGAGSCRGLSLCKLYQRHGKGPRSPARACLEREGHQYAAISAVPICQGGGSDAGTHRRLSVYHLWFCLYRGYPSGDLSRLQGSQLEI